MTAETRAILLRTTREEAERRAKLAYVEAVAAYANKERNAGDVLMREAALWRSVL